MLAPPPDPTPVTTPCVSSFCLPELNTTILTGLLLGTVHSVRQGVPSPCASRCALGGGLSTQDESSAKGGREFEGGGEGRRRGGGRKQGERVGREGGERREEGGRRSYESCEVKPLSSTYQLLEGGVKGEVEYSSVPLKVPDLFQYCTPHGVMMGGKGHMTN